MNSRDDTLHFTFPVAQVLFDARPLFSAIDKASAEGVNIGHAPRGKLGELSLHLATRAQLLVLCLKKLDGALATAIQTAIRSDPATLLPLGAEDLFSLLLFLDSFLFESFAYTEVLQKFFISTLVGILNTSKQEARSTFEKIRDQSGTVRGGPWRAFLAGVRNHFTHGATPWLAVDRRRRAEGVYDIVIMHENITDFTRADKRMYFSATSDLNGAWEGLMNTANNCHEYLLRSINGLHVAKPDRRSWHSSR